MSRPVKWRKIEKMPECSYFKPVGVPMYELEEVILKIEELEAIRLKDLESLDQNTCSERMGVSRQTFQRIYYSAKEKIADSLVNGKAIKIQGGNYARKNCKMICKNCNKEIELEMSQRDIKNIDALKCPNCGFSDFSCQFEKKCQPKCLRKTEE